MTDKAVVSSSLRNEIIQYFYKGHTCKDTDAGFFLKPGTTHDIIVEKWKRDRLKGKEKK